MILDSSVSFGLAVDVLRAEVRGEVREGVHPWGGRIARPESTRSTRLSGPGNTRVNSD
ncbi:hypothetical protein [Brevibacterium oceani]|uniref:hypothetical protein n=1 Tax=Brevibacterium oceani TaxID=358099 RepID=UPI0015E79928|nr:hypothetical protein [Brevibacterium oceani]